MATENLSTVVSVKPAVPAKSAQQAVDDDTYRQMLLVLDELTDHTHVFYDDYTTACDCNCDCNCTRGIL